MISGVRLVVTRTAAAGGFIRAWLINSSMYCSWAVGAAMPPDNSSRDSRLSKRSDRRKLGRVMADLPVYRLSTGALAPGRVRRTPLPRGDLGEGPWRLQEKSAIEWLSLLDRRGMEKQVACRIGQMVASGPLAQSHLAVSEQVIFRGQGDTLPARLNEREGGSTYRLHPMSRRTYKKAAIYNENRPGLFAKVFLKYDFTTTEQVPFSLPVRAVSLRWRLSASLLPSVNRVSLGNDLESPGAEYRDHDHSRRCARQGGPGRVVLTTFHRGRGRNSPLVDRDPFCPLLASIASGHRRGPVESPRRRVLRGPRIRHRRTARRDVPGRHEFAQRTDDRRERPRPGRLCDGSQGTR